MAKSKTNPVGRPTRYGPAMLKAANEYIKNFKDHGHAIPSVVGLAVVLGVAKSTVNLWGANKKHPEFSDTLEILKTYQEFYLLNGGLKGEHHAAITKLALANFGYLSRPGDGIDEDSDVEVVKVEIVRRNAAKHPD